MGGRGFPPHSRHHYKINRLMACNACLDCLVSTFSGCFKNPLQRTSASSKYKKAKAGRPTMQLGLPTLFCERSYACSLNLIFYQLKYFEQSTFLRYLCHLQTSNYRHIQWTTEALVSSQTCSFLHRRVENQLILPTWGKIDKQGMIIFNC
jgi:hypothetical protein